MGTDEQLPRMPYGMAKQIVATMRIGDAYFVRPEWLVSMHNAARRMGMRLASVSVRRVGQPMFRIIRVGEFHLTGHMAQRLPRRDQLSGQWLRKAAA